MQLRRVDEIEKDGRRFTLYDGGSFVLFAEEDDFAEGVGTIERTEAGYVVTAWWRPGIATIAPTLSAAVDMLVEIGAQRR